MDRPTSSGLSRPGVRRAAHQSSSARAASRASHWPPEAERSLALALCYGGSTADS